MKTFREGQSLLQRHEALSLIESLQPLAMPFETVPASQGLGRMLAEAVSAAIDLPEFRKSTMDGYGFAAKPVDGQNYHCVGAVEMGSIHTWDLGPDTCLYVPTGGHLPEVVTTLLPVEGVVINGKQIQVRQETLAANHWILPGEDVQSGQVLLPRGHVIEPMSLGLLSLIGTAEIKVYKKLKVALLTMGNELVGSFEKTQRGQIRDINQIVLKSLIEAFGAEVVYAARCKDDKAMLQQGLSEGLKLSDLVITSGSSSMGSADYIPELIHELADEGLLFHGLNIKPGKPVGLGLKGEKPLLALPGNPVSAAMTFVLIAQPLLASLLGLKVYSHHIQATLQSDCHSDGRETFIPVSLEGDSAIPHRGKSGLISQIATADGFFAIEAGGTAHKGDKVEIRLFGKDRLVFNQSL